MTLYVPFPSGTDPEARIVADWAEFTALAGRGGLKVGDLKSALSVEGVDNPDMIEQQVWTELRSRAVLHGELWPLRLEGSRLIRRRQPPVPIELHRFLCCLGMGVLEAEDRGLFELVVAEILPAITATESIHIGHPASTGMSASFRDRVKYYCEQSGILPEEVGREPLPSDNDMGVDAVTWMPFADGRSGYVHFLAQCATGANWPQKTQDIVIATWMRHIHWGVPPVRVFAVPFVIVTTNERWVRLCNEAGVLLDRPRLLELYATLGKVSDLLPILESRVAALAA
jgi:hypothetical protein